MDFTSTFVLIRTLVLVMEHGSTYPAVLGRIGLVCTRTYHIGLVRMRIVHILFVLVVAAHACNSPGLYLYHATNSYGPMSYENKGHLVRSGKFDVLFFMLCRNAEYWFVKLTLCNLNASRLLPVIVLISHSGYYGR